MTTRKLALYCGICHDEIPIDEPLAVAIPVGNAPGVAIHSHCTRQAVREMHAGIWAAVTDRWGHTHLPISTGPTHPAPF